MIKGGGHTARCRHSCRPDCKLHLPECGVAVFVCLFFVVVVVVVVVLFERFLRIARQCYIYFKYEFIKSRD